jgi:cytochrome c556
MGKAFLLIVLALMIILGVVIARNRPSADEQAVVFRQALMTVISGTFDPLLQMQTGREPYDATLVRRHADELPLLTSMIPEAFARNTSAARKLDTAALSYVWSDHQAFLQSAQRLHADASALQSAVRSGERESVDGAIGRMDAECAQCHRQFRAE